MKRIHVHVSVENVGKSISFYTTLFGTEPAVVKDDYAKWMLDDPRVNFAISDRARMPGVDHLGIQVETADELAELARRLKSAGEVTRDQEATTCCYAQSDKAWVNDPSGVRWETFYTFGEAVTYGEDEPDVKLIAKASACCGSSAQEASASAAKKAAACC